MESRKDEEELSWIVAAFICWIIVRRASQLVHVIRFETLIIPANESKHAR